MTEPAFDPKPQQVWLGKGNLGYRRSIDSAGTVAAPLLAGFSLTLLVLLLPDLGTTSTTVHVGAIGRVKTESHGFSAIPDVAAMFLLVAGLLLIGSVQAAISMRLYSHTPADYEEWYPEYFREGEAGTNPPADLAGWNFEGVAPATVGSRWYGAWPRVRLHGQVVRANRWAAFARWLYHGGIMALLLGLGALVLPPGTEETTGRWVLFGLAVAGGLAEAVWIALVA